jgi:LuxR family maltose regulon positive regulatory protein
MRFFHAAGDCDSLLLMMERDKTNCITYEHKDLLIRFYDEAPEACKRRHPVAVLAYAMCMMTFYESERFGRACEAFVSLLQGNDAASEENPPCRTMSNG